MIIVGMIVFSRLAFSAGPLVSPALIEKGKAAYAASCLMCHGDKGDGNGIAGAAMNPKPRNFVSDKFKLGQKPENIFKSISEGLPGTAMMGFGHLSEEDRWALTHFVVTFMKKNK
jgi:mono/diheme cytochrome c family protein